MYSVGPGPTCVAAEWSWVDQIRNARIRTWAGAVSPRGAGNTQGNTRQERRRVHRPAPALLASDDHHGQSNNGGIGDGGSGGPPASSGRTPTSPAGKFNRKGGHSRHAHGAAPCKSQTPSSATASGTATAHSSTKRRVAAMMTRSDDSRRSHDVHPGRPLAGTC